MWIICICVAVVLQTTVFSWFRVPGVKPDLILLVVLYAAFWKGSGRGAVVGFIGGMVEDIASGGLLGLNAFSKVLIGFIFGLSRKKFYIQSIRLHVIAAFLATIFSQLVVFALMQICGEERALVYFKSVLLPMAAYNAILAPFVLYILRKVIKERHDKTKPD